MIKRNGDVGESVAKALEAKDKAKEAAHAARMAEEELVHTLMDAGMYECFKVNWTAVKRWQ